MWEGKDGTVAIAMDTSLKTVTDWRIAKIESMGKVQSRRQESQAYELKWKAPEEGVLKINADASFVPESATFKVGMVLRDHRGTFIMGRTSCAMSPSSVFEAEAIGVREALSWIKMLQLHHCKIQLETDSLLVVQGVKSSGVNLLEVGEVLEQCRKLLSELSETSIHFVRNRANRVAHEFARMPCLVNCHLVFTSPPRRKANIGVYSGFRRARFRNCKRRSQGSCV